MALRTEANSLCIEYIHTWVKKIAICPDALGKKERKGSVIFLLLLDAFVQKKST